MEPCVLRAKHMAVTHGFACSTKCGAGLPMPSRVEDMPPSRFSEHSHPRTLPQEGNGRREAAGQKDNAMLPAARCPKRGEAQKRQRNHCGQIK